MLRKRFYYLNTKILQEYRKNIQSHSKNIAKTLQKSRKYIEKIAKILKIQREAQYRRYYIAEIVFQKSSLILGTFVDIGTYRI
jgi:hypothetical protein